MKEKKYIIIIVIKKYKCFLINYKLSLTCVLTTRPEGVEVEGLVRLNLNFLKNHRRRSSRPKGRLQSWVS